MSAPGGGCEPLDADLAADVVARMMETAARFVTEDPARHPSTLSLFVADAHLLTQVMGSSWGRPECEDIAGRLWMVGMTPLDVHDLAATTGASWAEKLITSADALRIAGSCARPLGARR